MARRTPKAGQCRSLKQQHDDAVRRYYRKMAEVGGYNPPRAEERRLTAAFKREIGKIRKRAARCSWSRHVTEVR